jgi:hypothetical protein
MTAMTTSDRPLPPVPPRPATEATRYLCAAAYLEQKFADRVVERVLRERHRAVAPSYGVDLHAVVRHCIAARRRKFVRALVLSIVLLVGGPLFLWLGASPLGACSGSSSSRGGWSSSAASSTGTRSSPAPCSGIASTSARRPAPPPVTNG